MNKTTFFGITLSISILLLGCSDEESGPMWRALKPMPTARHSFGMVDYNGQLYAIGGYNATGVKTVEAYDPATDTWTTKASMPTGRGYLVVAKANGKIYAIGGITGGNLDNISYLYTNEEYDPVTDEWTSKTPLPLAVLAPNSVLGNQFISGTTINNKIYIAGGSAGADIPTFVYDPVTNEWSQDGAPLSKFNLQPYTSVSTNGELYVSHGAEFLKYLPADDEWRLLKPLSVPRYGAALASSDEMIYAVGGYMYGTNDYIIREDVERYSLGTGNWNHVTSLKSNRHSSAAVMLNGRLYVAGGATRVNYSNIPVADFEVLEVE